MTSTEPGETMMILAIYLSDSSLCGRLSGSYLNTQFRVSVFFRGTQGNPAFEVFGSGILQEEFEPRIKIR